MRLAFFGYPRIQRVGCAILCGVSNGEVCPADFLAADVLLADFCLSLFILHNNFIHRTIFADGKGHIFCGQIAIRSGDFYQSVSCTSGQNAFQIMRLIGGYPTFNQLTICIIQGELCTRQFFASGQILLADGYLCGVILHGYRLQLAVCTNGKGNIFCICITIRSTNFMQRIGFACGQFCFDVMCICARYPFFYHVAILIQNLERCTRDLLRTSQILLADGNLCGIILHCNHAASIVTIYSNLACFVYGKGNGFCNGIAVRSGFFYQGVSASIQLNLFRCATRYPFCNGLASCIGNLEACTFQFFRAVDCLLADGNFAFGCVTHRHFCQTAVLVYCECNCFCNLITIWSGHFYQFILAASNQLAVDDMSFCAGCPSIDFGFSGFAQCVFGYIVQFQFCPFQFIRTSQGLLADGYLGHIVLHDNLTIDIFAVYGNLTALFYGKGDFFRIAIAIRCIGFLQDVGFSCGQLFLYGMRLIGGSPFFYNLAILIQNLEGCTRNFFATGEILLADGYLCNVILHDNCTIDILAVYGNRAILFYRKGNVFCISVAFRCIFFMQRVGFACNQLACKFVRLVARSPCFNNLAILIQNLEGCSRNFFAAGYRLLADGYLGHVILHDNLTVDILAVDSNLTGLVNGKGNVFCIRITIRCVFFVQGIGCIGVQDTLQNINVLTGDPLCNLFAVFVQNRKGCPFYFCRSGDILLADGNFCCRILHDNSCDFALFIHSEFDIFGISIAIRCTFFVEGVSLASNQLFVDLMRLVGRSPFFDDLTGFILNLKLCSRNFLVASNVLLTDGYLGGVILHHDDTASIHIFAVFVLYCNLASFINCKGHGFCDDIAIRSGFFCQGVSASIQLNLLWCLARYPLCNGFTSCIGQFQACTFQFIGAVHGLLADGEFALGCVTHYNFCQCTVFVYSKGNVFCNLIAVRSGDFYQLIGAASNQLAIDDMSFCAGCPSIDFGFSRFALFVFGYIVQFQFCTSQFIRTSQCLLANGYLCDIVVHGNFRYLAGLIYGKLHIFRICISIRSILFMERIFLACNQLAVDFVRLVRRCPFVYNITVFILNLERCPRDFIVASDVLLADGYLGHIVVHGNFRYLAGLIYGKLHIFRICISIRSILFMERIFLACNQLAVDFVRLVRRCPFVYNITVFILNLERCSWDFVVASDVLLADGYLGRIIFHENCTIDIFAVYGYLACCIHNKFNGFCNRVTIRSGFFCQGICASIQLNGLWCAARYPFCNGLAVCIGNLQACTFEFFRAIDCTLADDNITQRCISHGHLTIYIFAIYQNLTGLVNGKGNGFCNLITIRSGDFYQFVSAASNQCTFYYVCFCAGCPSIYFGFSRFALIVLSYIVQFQLCTSQFIRTSHCLFADGYLCDIIFHDNHAVFILVCCVYCDRAVLFNRKGDIFGIHITIRSVLFVERIGLTSSQLSADVMRLVGGCPFFNDLTSFILYLEGCSWYFGFAGNISLVDGYLCDIILHDDHAVFILVCCIYCNRAVLFNRKGDIFGIRITIRSSSFFQRISSARQANNVLCSIARCPLNTIAHCCQICVCSSNCFPLFCGQVIIGQSQGCSCNFVFASDVSLVNLNRRTFVLDDQDLSIFGLFNFAVCYFRYGCYNAVLYNKGKGRNRCESVRSSDFFQFIRAIRQSRNGNISLECCGCCIFCNLGCTNLNTVQRCIFILCSQLEFCFFCCDVSAVKCFLVDLNGACFVGDGDNCTFLTFYRYFAIFRNGNNPFLCRCEVTRLSRNFRNFISSSR